MPPVNAAPLPVLSLSARAVSLAYTVSGQLPAGGVTRDTTDSLIKELSEQARAADPQKSREAIEVLVNFSMGPRAERGQEPTDQQKLTQQALDALLTLAGDVQVSPHVRASARELAFDAFEISQGMRFKPGADGKSSQPPVGWTSAYQVPPSLLALAMRHAEAKGYKGQKSAIDQGMRDGLKVAPGTDEGLKDPNRYCLFEEIQHGMRNDDAASLPFFPQPLATIHLTVLKGTIRQLYSSALDARRPQSAVIHHNNHWVALVISPSATQGKVDVAVYDTLRKPEDERAREISRQLEFSLPKEKLGNLTYAGDNVQGTTNGCGPFCVRALRGLAAALEKKPTLSPAEYFQRDLAALKTLDRESLADVAAGWRGRMVEGLCGDGSASRPDQASGEPTTMPAASHRQDPSALLVRKVRRVRRVLHARTPTPTTAESAPVVAGPSGSGAPTPPTLPTQAQKDAPRVKQERWKIRESSSPHATTSTLTSRVGGQTSNTAPVIFHGKIPQNLHAAAASPATTAPSTA